MMRPLLVLVAGVTLLGTFFATDADPADLVGTWTVNLRPTPDSEPYTLEM